MKKLYNGVSIESEVFNNHILRESNKHSKSHKVETTRTKSKIMKSFFEKISKAYFKQAKTVLCVGCRDEIELDMFENHNIKGLGIDPAVSTPKIKKLPAEKMLEVFKENEFDFVYSSHSLEHVVIPEIVLKNIRKVANTGCYIILPLEVRDNTDQSHPNIFDISKKNSKSTKKELIKSLKEDFQIFEPYEIEDIFYFEYDNNIYEPEFHMCFKWLDS